MLSDIDVHGGHVQKSHDLSMQYFNQHVQYKCLDLTIIFGYSLGEGAFIASNSNICTLHSTFGHTDVLRSMWQKAVFANKYATIRVLEHFVGV